VADVSTDAWARLALPSVMGRSLGVSAYKNASLFHQVWVVWRAPGQRGKLVVVGPPCPRSTNLLLETNRSTTNSNQIAIPFRRLGKPATFSRQIGVWAGSPYGSRRTLFLLGLLQGFPGARTVCSLFFGLRTNPGRAIRCLVYKHRLQVVQENTSLPTGFRL
jgi:hypothetical protein